MGAIKKAVPTSIRLSETIRDQLAEEARRQQRSLSFIVEEAMKLYLKRQASGIDDMPRRQKYAMFNAAIEIADKTSVKRTTDEIDIMIREIRGDR